MTDTNTAVDGQTSDDDKVVVRFLNHLINLDTAVNRLVPPYQPLPGRQTETAKRAAADNERDRQEVRRLLELLAQRDEELHTARVGAAKQQSEHGHDQRCLSSLREQLEDARHKNQWLDKLHGRLNLHLLHQIGTALRAPVLPASVTYQPRTVFAIVNECEVRIEVSLGDIMVRFFRGRIDMTIILRDGESLNRAELAGIRRLFGKTKRECRAEVKASNKAKKKAKKRAKKAGGVHYIPPFQK